MSDEVRLELSQPQALVLLDLVARLNQVDGLPIEDQAEQRVLWDLEATLEAQVKSVLAEDYRERLSRARQQVRDRD